MKSTNRLRLENFISLGSGPAVAGKLPWQVCAEMKASVQMAIAALPAGYRMLSPEVAVHETATIEDGAVLKPPCIIEAASFVAAHAYLRGGVWLGRAATIGPSVEIKSSLIGRNTCVAHFNFVGDSIVGADVNIEAGAILANHRNESAEKEIVCILEGVEVRTGCEKFESLVGDRCRIGANAVLAPGTILSRGRVVPRLKLIDQFMDRARL